MYYKALMLDLDDTLYSYETCHRLALNRALKECSLEVYVSVYDEARCKVKRETSGSHNKCLYFKVMCETLGLPLETVIQLTDVYWRTFYSIMEPYPGVLEFMRWHKDLGIPICIITNYQTEHQLRKLEVLGLLPYVHSLITSEDVGVNKPDSKIFLTALARLGTNPLECMMIGDDHMADMVGASSVGIGLIHHATEGWDWADLLVTLQGHRALLLEFQGLCKYCGARKDLVQAGGGNISVKLGGGLMAIKASGLALGQVTDSSGYVLLKDGRVVAGLGRASIETEMHQRIDDTFVIHLHPPSVINVGPADFNRMFPHAHILPYIKPGPELAKRVPPAGGIIYLQNHGLVISGSSEVEVRQCLDSICARDSGISDVSDIVRSHPGGECYMAQLCGPYRPSRHLVTPDAAVYCGYILENLTPSALGCYIATYGTWPSMVTYRGSIYTIATTPQRCQDIEDVYRSSLECQNCQTLDPEDIADLLNWDAEKYRKRLS